MGVSATRFHQISAGHRVCGHEGKCQHLHGHNYGFHLTCEPTEGLDSIGRVIDFSVIKELLCEWLEDNWDHHFLVWEEDLLKSFLLDIDSTVVVVPFNPTAENLAGYMVNVVGPIQLLGTGVILTKVIVEETAKCSATYEIENHGR